MEMKNLFLFYLFLQFVQNGDSQNTLLIQQGQKKCCFGQSGFSFQLVVKQIIDPWLGCKLDFAGELFYSLEWNVNKYNNGEKRSHEI